MKYIIEFTKTGTICYTSHLDIMKVFKRAFKRAGIRLAHSQGFNPHPKMGFAQPLSLGYWSLQEYIEFETDGRYDAEEHDSDKILESLRLIMPEGLKLVRIIEAGWLKKTLAAANDAAEYIIEIPATECTASAQELWDSYMLQDRIVTLKKQKKKAEPVSIDIKPKIRTLTFKPTDDAVFIDALLDSGSSSNLSPELLITTITDRLKLDVSRPEIKVMRKKLYFNSEVQTYLDKK